MNWELRDKPVKKIVLITDKQPSSNPRLVKEAAALYREGYEVTVIYNFWSQWAEDADKNIFEQWPGIKWIRVGGHPLYSKLLYWFSRIRHKLYKILAARFPGNLSLQVHASAQFYPNLFAAACHTTADLYIAHNLAALPAAAEAAKKNNTRYAFDAEDFHRSQEGVTAQQAGSVIVIEDHYFAKTQYITAASPLIGAEYKKNYPGKEFTTVNNVFSKKQQPPFVNLAKSPLKLFWFSQTVGLSRGLQDILSAVNLISDFTVELNILGDIALNTKNTLTQFFGSSAHVLNFLSPCNEDELIRICSTNHIGLALEPGYSLNYQVALTNKVFTYILAGNALILSATPAQQLFFEQYNQAAWCYPVGDIHALANILEEAWNDDELLNSKRRTAWQLGNTTLNWETEQGKFLSLVKKAV